MGAQIPDNGIDTSPTTLIRYVQQRRMEALLSGEELTEGTANLLASVARTSLDQTRIMVESGSVAAQKKIAVILAKLTNTITHNPFINEGAAGNRATMDVKVPEVDLVEGELSTDHGNLDYNEIVGEN